MKKMLLLGILPVLVCLAHAGSPVIRDVDPEQGFVDEDTEAIVTGEDFEIGGSVSLLAGGPILAGGYGGSWEAKGVAIRGDYVYLADFRFGLRILDAGNPRSPVPVGSHSATGLTYDIGLRGDHAYLAAFTAGLRIIDVSNPEQPGPAGSYDTSGQAMEVAMVGDFAYVADGGSGLQIIDISNPHAPAFVGSYDTPGATGSRLRSITETGGNDHEALLFFLTWGDLNASAHTVSAPDPSPMWR